MYVSPITKYNFHNRHSSYTVLPLFVMMNKSTIVHELGLLVWQFIQLL